MHILVIGATGGTGREVVTQALDVGYHVTAFARNPASITLTHPHLRTVQGNVLERGSIEHALKGIDAVLCVLGHKRFFIPSNIFSTGTLNLVHAMESTGVKRLICVTSLGIGETRGKLGLYYSLFVIPFITYFYFRDKERQEKMIMQSSLDWTIIRPGQLTSGKARQRYRHGNDVGSYVKTVMISRADVAHFMLKVVAEGLYSRQSVSVAN